MSLGVALSCTAAAAVTNWSTRVRPKPLLESISKPLTTLLVMWVAIEAGGPRTPTVLALVGLLFCLVGDIALLAVVDRFVIGLGAFLIGHVVFIVMFVTLHLRHPLWAVVAAALLAVHVVGFARRILAGAVEQKAALRVPVSAYLVVILTMAVVAAATGRWWAIAGAASFVVSDTVLGWGRFVRAQAWMPLTVMVTYHAAIVGLALSLR